MLAPPPLCGPGTAASQDEARALRRPDARRKGPGPSSASAARAREGRRAHHLKRRGGQREQQRRSLPPANRFTAYKYIYKYDKFRKP